MEKKRYFRQEKWNEEKHIVEASRDIFGIMRRPMYICIGRDWVKNIG